MVELESSRVIPSRVADELLIFGIGNQVATGLFFRHFRDIAFADGLRHAWLDSVILSAAGHQAEHRAVR